MKTFSFYWFYFICYVWQHSYSAYVKEHKNPLEDKQNSHIVNFSWISRNGRGSQSHICYITNTRDMRCIRVLGFWCLKRGFRRTFNFFCSKGRQTSAFLQTMYLSCVWKWIRSREQNSVPESRRATLHSVKVIKMSWLTIDRFPILWRFTGSFVVAKQTEQLFYP